MNTNRIIMSIKGLTAKYLTIINGQFAKGSCKVSDVKDIELSNFKSRKRDENAFKNYKPQ